VYSALALALGTPETKADEGASRRGAAALADLMEACGADELAPLAHRLARKAPSKERHEQLFGHTTHGEVPPYETHYGSDTLFQQPRELADIGGFLSAFALVVSPSSHERVDHVSSECELMAFLAGKEAHALDRHDESMLASTRDAEVSFLRDHLGRFAPAFGQRLFRSDPDGFYGGVGRLLRAFVEWECARLGVEAGSPGLELRRASLDEGAPMACGSQGGCALGRCE
jgi:TorA maturation chaperone TorD